MLTLGDSPSSVSNQPVYEAPMLNFVFQTQLFTCSNNVTRTACMPYVRSSEINESQLREFGPRARPFYCFQCAPEAELIVAWLSLTINYMTTRTVNPLASASVFFPRFRLVIAVFISLFFLSILRRLRGGGSWNRLGLAVFVLIVSAPATRAMQSVTLPLPIHAEF